ncbi:hypothetical protein FLL45_16025 [Aliikangiella marina]|uniref:Uncharacterized protein n=1 Tax=Aliikangiella marina TaxID=1712262 RepID=A0A545T6W8_9GAMM|nr:hypothetical protein [Aliikangiella marina]TQV72970.1 hypothetical protein FLL45_16025 [Aliikangiella marina]
MEESIKPKIGQPDLTANIERKVCGLIDSAEQKAKQEGQYVDAKLYLQLADLFHFHKKYQKEVQILKRFTHFKYANRDEFVDILERIENAKELDALVEKQKEKVAPLALVPDDDHDAEKKEEFISISSEKKVERRVSTGKEPFETQSLKVIALSAVYTGISDKDEIAEVAMVLFEYTPSRMKKSKIINTYWGSRKTRNSIPKKTINQFNLNVHEKEVLAFDKDKALAMFDQADLVVSHNDAEIERKLMATLVPEMVNIQWYSSERDIPWRAMGFESNRLTQLAGQLDEKIPRSCMDRAMFISRMLQRTEPFSNHVYLERLYNMQPMKAFEWTDGLKKQTKKIARGSGYNAIWVAIGVTVIAITGVTLYLISQDII